MISHCMVLQADIETLQLDTETFKSETADRCGENIFRGEALGHIAKASRPRPRS